MKGSGAPILPANQQERRQRNVHDGPAKGARSLLRLSRLPAWLCSEWRHRFRCRVRSWVATGDVATRRSYLRRAPQFVGPKWNRLSQIDADCLDLPGLQIRPRFKIDGLAFGDFKI